MTRATLSNENEFPIGRIAGIFGIRGELKCDPTSSGRALFSKGAQLSCEIDGARRIVRISGVREHKGRLLIVLDEVTDATAAEKYVGATFYAPREKLDVERGEYLDVDLVGCEIVSESGRPYGSVTRVEHYPANDMLVVGKYMLPMVHAFIKNIDIAHKRITVDVPPGLLDDDADADDVSS